MFDRILVALDGSEEARSAGTLGLRVAEHMRSRVTGLSVIDVRVVEGPAVETLAPLWGEVTGRPFQPEVMRLYRERADSALDDFCAAAEGAGLEPIQRCVEIGVAEDAILDRAVEADLLVMGRRGEHAGFGRRALGATLWRVLHRAPCPVLVAGPVAPTEAPGDGEPGGSDIPRRPLVAWERGPGGSFGGLANAGFFLLDEDKSSARDPHMFYIQPGLSFSAGDHFSGKMGVVYYDFEHVKGMVPNEDLSSGTNTRVDGRLKYGYDSLNPNLVLAYATGGPGGHGYTLTFIGDYIYNFEAKDSGFLVGVRAGHPSVKKRASWIAYYNYRRLERDAFMDVFPDSDFYGGATNVRGHEFVFQYAVVQNVIMGLDYYRAEKLDGDSAPLNTLQIDCVFRF